MSLRWRVDRLAHRSREAVLELGWAVRDARTGRGYATELGRAALAWAAEHRSGEPVVALTEVHNRASRAVMERLGMLRAGTIWLEGLVEDQTGVQPDAPFALLPDVDSTRPAGPDHVGNLTLQPRRPDRGPASCQRAIQRSAVTASGVTSIALGGGVSSAICVSTASATAAKSSAPLRSG